MEELSKRREHFRVQIRKNKVSKDLLAKRNNMLSSLHREDDLRFLLKQLVISTLYKNSSELEWIVGDMHKCLHLLDLTQIKADVILFETPKTLLRSLEHFSCPHTKLRVFEILLAISQNQEHSEGLFLLLRKLLEQGRERYLHLVSSIVGNLLLWGPTGKVFEFIVKERVEEDILEKANRGEQHIEHWVRLALPYLQHYKHLGYTATTRFFSQIFSCCTKAYTSSSSSTSDLLLKYLQLSYPESLQHNQDSVNMLLKLSQSPSHQSLRILYQFTFEHKWISISHLSITDIINYMFQNCEYTSLGIFLLDNILVNTQIPEVSKIVHTLVSEYSCAVRQSCNSEVQFDFVLLTDNLQQHCASGDWSGQLSNGAREYVSIQCFTALDTKLKDYNERLLDLYSDFDE